MAAAAVGFGRMILSSPINNNNNNDLGTWNVVRGKSFFFVENKKKDIIHQYIREKN